MGANPSEEVVRQLARRSGPSYDLITATLPTEFEAAGAEIERLLKLHEPDVCICLGLNAAAEGIQLERVAVNRMSASSPDNAGFQPTRQPCLASGIMQCCSTLPLESMHAALCARGAAVAYSDSAGTFVCNHVFYRAVVAADRLRLGTLAGFIHLPWPNDLLPRPTPTACAFCMAALTDAVETCLDIATEAAASGARPLSAL